MRMLFIFLIIVLYIQTTQAAEQRLRAPIKYTGKAIASYPTTKQYSKNIKKNLLKNNDTATYTALTIADIGINKRISTKYIGNGIEFLGGKTDISYQVENRNALISLEFEF